MISADPFRVAVAVDTPQHAGLPQLLDYASDQALAPGTIVRVPLGTRESTGIVWEGTASDTAPSLLRPLIEAIASLPPLPAAWRRLVDFAAAYYQRSVGEIAIAALPSGLRNLDDARVAKRLSRAKCTGTEAHVPPSAPSLTDEQRAVLGAIHERRTAMRSERTPTPLLLHGATGSGKTEIYLRLVEEELAAGRQSLLLVPEINLTPQLESRVAERFPGRRVVSLHSGLTTVRRLSSWLDALLGTADIVLGTRLAIFTPLQRPGLIVVDEEHDASYKQQEGARYSARDLAIVRARLEGSTVLLGSATPSLESWRRAKEGRYALLSMPRRIGDAHLPTVRTIDMTREMLRLPPAERRRQALASPLVAAISSRIERGEQSLLLLNRRGYAPVLHCADCGWKSDCPNCSAWRVFHKNDRSLRCHHCGLAERVPRACPACGNLDIQPIGRGTEKLQEQAAALFPGARIARIDADSARRAGALQAQLAAVHAGEVDVLIGTQMITKGHDFRRITLVAAVDPDGALFASDFRAAERLFALLMQAAGRAGRDAVEGARSEMWLQTAVPAHPLFETLRRHDYPAFADRQLDDRRNAGLPPFSHLALLRAEARQGDAADAFLAAARIAGEAIAESAGVVFYSPVPPVMARVAGFERRQMLVESSSRTALQRLLSRWTPLLRPLRAAHKAVVRWAIDVDPLAI